MLNNIAFDLDGVLVDIMHTFIYVYEHLYGKPFPNGKCNEYNLCKTTNLTEAELWDIFEHCYDLYEHVPVYPGANELLAKLYEKTKEPPLILTARPFASATQTYKLVQRVAGKTPFQLVLKDPEISKAHYIAGRYRYFVEDRRKTVLELHLFDIEPILVRTSYNEINGNGRIWKIDGVHELISKIKLFVSVLN